MIDKVDSRYDIKPPQPKIVGPDYVQSFDNMSATDFMKIYLETLRYQDPFKANDISKAMEDLVRLNQIRYYTEMQSFIEKITSWFNQMTFLQTLSLLGKEFLFETKTLDTLKGGDYYILSYDNVDNVTIEILDGDEVIKRIETDLVKGLNPLDISDLPRGQFTVRIKKEDLELDRWKLGIKDIVVASGIIDGELMLDTASDRQFPASNIIYAGGN